MSIDDTIAGVVRTIEATMVRMQRRERMSMEIARGNYSGGIGCGRHFRDPFAKVRQQLWIWHEDENEVMVTCGCKSARGSCC